MSVDVRDTIVALSSASGTGAHAIVRLSGSESVQIIRTMFTGTMPIRENERRRHEGEVSILQSANRLPAEVYIWPAPRTYTGQQMVEIHTLICPPLIDVLIAGCLDRGARAAQPGEFTMRAFLAGKLDLTRAEAVLAVIEADNRNELRQALQQLAGGITQPLQELRSDLLDLLADVEAGLDFSDEDITFVHRDDLLTRITRGLALLTLLRQQVDRRAMSEQPFRVVLAGPPNAGKSSLFNALGRGGALVSQMPGTTRDYLLQRLELDGTKVELVDTAGWQQASNEIDDQAQQLGKEQRSKANLMLYCVEARNQSASHPDLFEGEGYEIISVATKCDLASAPPGHLATSAKTGMGLEGLRALLRQKARKHARPALAPSLARCRNHVENGLEHLRRAHHLVLEEEMPELLALELRGALDQLGEMVGAVYTNDLLDRIFSRFCIGK